MPYKDKEKAREHAREYYHRYKNTPNGAKKIKENKNKTYQRTKDKRQKEAYDRFLDTRNNETPLEDNQYWFFDQKKVKKAINDTGSIREVASSINMRASTLGSIHRGRNRSKLKTIKKICIGLGLSLEDILIKKTKIGKNITE